MSIYYFDALAGAGKTRALARYALWLAGRSKKVLFAQPSKLLIRQTFRTEIEPLKPSCPVTQFHGDVSDAVIADLAAHLEAAQPGGEIVLTTHAALLRLPLVKRGRDWIVLVDEVPSVDVFEKLDLPETHHLLTDFITLLPNGAAYGELRERDDQSGLGRIARNKHGDSVFKLFENFSRRIVSDHWSVHALQSSFESMLRGDKANGCLTTYSLLRPSIFGQFRKTIIASACFKDTMLYQLWAGQVSLKPVTAGRLVNELRYQQHQNGSLITIAYVSDENWSKTMRNRLISEDDEHVRVLDRILQLVANVMGDDPFAWLGNKDLPDDLFKHLPGAVRLPNSPHGLNSFQHLHQIVILSALNPPPAHFSFMGSKGIGSDEVRTSHYRTTVYQAVRRISNRDPQNQMPNLVVVMDRDTAYWLADLFPGAKVEAMTGLGVHLKKGKPGPKAIHKSQADRSRACRARKQEELLGDLLAINGSGIEPLSYEELCSQIRFEAGQKTRNEITSIRRSRVTNFGTAFTDKFSSRPFLTIDLDEDDEFIGLLRSLHDEIAESKEHNILLSPAYFNPDMPGTETNRGLANITHVRGIWMDNDGGDLTHKEFARLFPYLRIAVWNTYSSTPENPRWRAFIPTSYAMSVEVHRCVMAQIEKVLKDAGYRSKRDIEQLKGKSRKAWLCHGFDTSKFNAASLFYAPCQAAHPQGSFFVDYDNAKRGPLDLHGWIDNCILELKPKPEPDLELVPDVVASSIPLPLPAPDAGLIALREKLAQMKAHTSANWRQEKIDKAANAWRCASPGTGHTEFFRLAVALKNAGLDHAEIRQKLHEEAFHARSPRKRKDEIRDIMRSIEKVGTFRRENRVKAA